MIRGVIGVVPWHKAELGRFYMSAGYGRGPWLFQYIQSEGLVDGVAVTKALVFTIDSAVEISIQNLPENSEWVELYDVHVRIDPTSLNMNTELSLQNLFLFGDQPVFCASNGPMHGWLPINLNDGKYFHDRRNRNLVSFDRWSLVLDDDSGEEIMIASFDAALQTGQAR